MFIQCKTELKFVAEKKVYACSLPCKGEKKPGVFSDVWLVFVEY